MPLFRYEALAENGRKLRGVIDADGAPAAREKLHQQRVFVTLLKAASATKRMTLSASLLLDFTRGLQQLLGAGLPLYESLLTLEEKYRSHRAHAVFLDLCDHLKRGKALSLALHRYPESFGEVYVSTVQTAEETGQLAEIFLELSELLERQIRLKKQLISAIAYPAFLLGFCCIVFLSLLLFVIPSMAPLFEGRSLHPLTEFVLAMSRGLHTHGISLLIGGLLSIFVATLSLRSSVGRMWLERMFLRLPIVKTVMIQSSLIRWARSLSMLLGGGVPLIEALRLARQTMRCRPLESVMLQAEERVMQGHTLSGEVKKSPLIPSLVPRMLAISEETGSMGEMLRKLAAIYEEELGRSLQTLTTVLGPLLLILLGALIGLVLLSVLLPLTDVGSLIAFCLRVN
jgi:general secretion pathway protein F/type IV pilus assembly protein PilC